MYVAASVLIAVYLAHGAVAASLLTGAGTSSTALKE